MPCRFRLLLAALPFVLAGCAEHWVKPGVKPGASDADARADLAQCEARAAQAYPYDEQTTRFGNVLARNRASCTQSGVFLTCTGGGPDLALPTSVVYDANAGRRRQALEACMAERGWQPASATGRPPPQRDLP